MNALIFDISLNDWTAVKRIEFIIAYLIPKITCLARILGGIWTLYKYFKGKNRDFYSRILENVYEPFFEELIKMNITENC
jgi:hypothetical protein